MPIAKLPALLVNQIAAGEVIERPASVVKELVENSLDAGATRIDITIEDGGRQLVRVSDNGAGIAGAELSLAVEPHATSKLTGPQDLAAIGSLGFRGEALASIASVSRVRIASRSRSSAAEEEGHVVVAQGEQVEHPVPFGCPPGTMVEVRDMFFNTPARRKFMRSASTEFGHINEIFTRIAMAWPEISFSLTHNGRQSQQLAPSQTRRQRCVALLGKDIEEALLEVEADPSGGLPGPPDVGPPDRAMLWGLVGMPAIARSSGKFQYICLNGRPVRDRNVAHAIREAYRGLIPHDRYPLAVVMLNIEPQFVDVNVHPTKSEVRFRDPARIHGLVLTAIRQRLLGTDLTPAISFDQASSNPMEAAKGSFPSIGGSGGKGGWTSNAISGSSTSSRWSADSFVDHFRSMDTAQKGFVYQEVKKALAEDDSQALEDENHAGQSDDDSESLLVRQPAAGSSMSGQTVLQVHEMYLVTQDEQGLLIVDQHALHERVMFEQLLARLSESEKLESQRLLMPATFVATPKQLALLEQIQPLLGRLGIDAAPIGPDRIGIHAFCSFLFHRNVDPIEFVEQLLADAEDEKLAPGGAVSDRESDRHLDPLVDEAMLHKVLNMMACKAAVKAGDPMSQEELAALLAQRDEIERSSNCPHGRPTSVRLTLRDLAKHFKRT